MIREIEKAGYGAICPGEKNSGTASPSFPVVASRSRPAEVCPATLTTTKAAISFAKVASLSLLGANAPSGPRGSWPQKTNAGNTWLSAMFHSRSRNDQGEYCCQSDLISA
jgi:hypothetical protein